MSKFKKIYIYSKKVDSLNQQATLKKLLDDLIKILEAHYCEIYFDINCQQLLEKSNFSNNYNDSTNCDLVIVIGGDGSLLAAIRAQINSNHQVPILGINQGRLGFLADLEPIQLNSTLPEILNGKFIAEPRTLLQTKIQYQGLSNNYAAINEIVLYSAKTPKLIEFQLFIDGALVFQPRADGLVIATPTGSTAYALSAGGSILDPKLSAIAIVPLYPHSLTTRPLIVPEPKLMELKIINYNPNVDYGINFDGQHNIWLQPGEKILITKHPKTITLIHPMEYNYFEILRNKLKWN